MGRPALLFILRPPPFRAARPIFRNPPRFRASSVEPRRLAWFRLGPIFPQRVLAPPLRGTEVVRLLSALAAPHGRKKQEYHNLGEGASPTHFFRPWCDIPATPLRRPGLLSYSHFTRQLRLVFVAGVLFEPMRQFLVARRDSAQLRPEVRVAGLGSGRHFLRACSQFHGKR